jgi:hypothetical protein
LRTFSDPDTATNPDCAVSLTDTFFVTAVELTVTVTVLLPFGTMQVAGRDATGRDADVSITVVSTSAAAVRVTVSWLLEPPFTAAGKRVIFDTSTGVI